MVFFRVAYCLSCVVTVLAFRRVRNRERGPPLKIPQLAADTPSNQSKQWTMSPAACMKSTEGTCQSSSSGSSCEQRFGATRCVDFQCVCSSGMCANTSGVCTRLVSRQHGIHAIRFLNSAPGAQPKFLGVEFGFKAFGPFWDPAWLRKGPDFYLAAVDSTEPQWLVTDIGDGFVRLESTVARGKVLSFAGLEGVQLRDMNTSKAINIGFKVQGGPDAYELVFHQGQIIRADSFRLLGQVTSSWMIIALWLCLLLAVVGGASCCFADHRMLRLQFVAIIVIWMLVFLHSWVPAYGVSFCRERWQCFDRQKILFEPALEQSIVDQEGHWLRPHMINVHGELLRWTMLPALVIVLLFGWCSIGIYILDFTRKAYARQTPCRSQNSPCAVSARLQ